VSEQKQEDLERLVPEFDPQTVLAQFARVWVHFEYPETDRAGIPRHTRASQIEYTSRFTRLDKALSSDELGGNIMGTQIHHCCIDLPRQPMPVWLKRAPQGGTNDASVA
jgi:hypothetical protein